MLVTFIRHGESTDNLRPVWAGWSDAPLSNHGMNQARALGKHWENTPVTAVYCSDLKRAHSTAQALVAGQPAAKPDLPNDKSEVASLSPVVTPLLREQNFGIAEGELWAASPDSNPNAKSEAEQVYYTIHTRHDKFEGGESLDDLAARADRAIDETVWPHVLEALCPRPPLRLSERVDVSDLGEPAPRKPEDAHIVLVSHGLAISELVAALLRRSPKATSHVHGPRAFKGLPNTGWTQVMIDIQPVTSMATTDVGSGASAPPVEMEVRSIHIHSVNNAPHLAHILHLNLTHSPLAFILALTPTIYVFAIRTIQFVTDHINEPSMKKRQAGGIGSSAHDEKQRGIREFFGGGNSTSS